MHRSLARSCLAWSAGTALLASPVFAQTSVAPPIEPPAEAPTGGPPAGGSPPVAIPPLENPSSDAPDARDKIVPEVRFENVAVEDVVQFLQDVAKDYRAVVVRKSKNEEGPLITMRLKNVSVHQVIQVIMAAHGGIEVTPVDGPGGAVDVISIHPQEGGGFGMGGGVPGMPGVPAPAEPERAVRVYRLASIVQMMMERRAPAGAGDAEKESLDKVLSLIKATLELAGGREAPTIQVHPETLTLIFKGSPQQHAALNDVLTALEGNRPVRAAGAEDVSNLKKQLAEAQARFESAMQESAQARAELSAIQRRNDNEIQDLTNLRQANRAEIEALRQKLADMERQAANPKP